ncbi:MAG: phosphotransferase [Nitrosomonas sp.]|nr:phosphotransferase [Nitrosomonas sp.]MDP1950819.1 phosphotransferase [Nitrosomonas sp.]
MERLQLLQNWIKVQFPGEPFTLTAASSDASFRRYFRASSSNRTLIVMDAPPQQEDCAPFLQVARLFATTGVHVPTILAQNVVQGFLLLSDLGSTTYLQALTANANDADGLYHGAMDALIKIQLASRAEILPDYGGALLLGELNLFTDWYIGKHLQITLSADQKARIDAVFTEIVKNNLSQPKVFVHRDFHSRNLMVTKPNPGIIDFQDAVYGPITYDLVSLFKDAYIQWDETRVLDWMIRYWEKAKKAGLPVNPDFPEFYCDFEWMGVQRHLKVLGIFARLCYRDGKDTYLNDMPLVMDYLRKACKRYRPFHPMIVLLDELEGTNPAEKIGYGF